MTELIDQLIAVAADGRQLSVTERNRLADGFAGVLPGPVARGRIELHEHHRLQQALKVPGDHVIIDRDVYEVLVQIYPGAGLRKYIG